jgi:uncharacterized membrane protein YphA (DoxX/SURF4 family)
MLIGTMIGALGMVHLPMGHPFVSADPNKPSFELALAYLASAVTVLLTGPGTLSLDGLLFNRKPAGSQQWATNNN